MKKKITVVGIIVLAFALCLSLIACGGKDEAKNYADGTYEGRSSDVQGDSEGVGAGYGVVTLTLKNNVITDCEFKLYELDGTLKDETYGAGLSEFNRKRAQKAAQSAPLYAAALVKNNGLKGVDGISGATLSYGEFVEAVKDALAKAEIKE
ncbi:MAG: FMN-binding protein [Clostridia bacterium]|nr:FMN-binding protein [Clostridia bacterium]